MSAATLVPLTVSATAPLNASTTRAWPPIAVAPPSVLVATDGGTDAEAAVLAGERVALRLGATLHALAVLAPLSIYNEQSMPQPPEVATARQASLVVLGIGRHGLVDRLLGPETALSVLRGGHRPVLAVGPDADGLFRRAVVAVDFGPASVRAAAIACRLLAPGGMLSLVYVKPRLELSGPSWTAVDAPAGPGPGERLQRLAAGLRHGTTGCDECGADTGRSDVGIGTATLVGEPAAELLDYAERVGADLVAVGTRGLGVVARLLVGSVATDTVRLTSARLPACSVLACPAPCPTVAARMSRQLLGTREPPQSSVGRGAHIDS